MKNIMSFLKNRSNLIMVIAILIIGIGSMIGAAVIKKTADEQKTANVTLEKNENSTDFAEGTEAAQDSSGKMTCTIAISCDSILNNMSKLRAGKEAFVPSDGCILDTMTMEFCQGETVLDILNRACGSKEIQLEYSYSPAYDSYYVEGIHHLYEFDCGSSSGWTYQVNGVYPNYGCSSYTLSDGDTILWSYTCTG